jgi:2-methylisocitrate lyase-like PEP mutase family enzyme
MSSVATQKRLEFRRLLCLEGCQVAPGAADVLTARLVVHAGFPAVFLSGSLLHALRGYPDLNVLTMTEMVEAAAQIADAIPVPCLADGETGFGNGINVSRTVQEYERAGVGAIMIEDSTVPKRPSRLGYDSPTVTTGEFLDKIKTAADARRDNELVILARSELRGDNAAKLDRLAGAIECGADAVWAGGFAESELPDICARLNRPAIAVLPGRLTAQQFGRLGVKMGVITGALAVAGVMAQVRMLDSLRETGSWSAWLSSQSDYAFADEFYRTLGKDTKR